MATANSLRGFYVYFDEAVDYDEDAPLSALTARTIVNNAGHLADSPAMQIRVNDIAKVDTGFVSTIGRTTLPVANQEYLLKYYTFPWTFRADGTPAVPVLRARCVTSASGGTTTVRYVLTSDHESSGLNSAAIAEWSGTITTAISTVVGGAAAPTNVEGLSENMQMSFTIDEEGADGTDVGSVVTTHMARLSIGVESTVADKIIYLKAVHLREYYFG